MVSKVTDQRKASVKLLAISSDNTTTFLQRSPVSSVIPASATIVFMRCSTSSLPPATGKDCFWHRSSSYSQVSSLRELDIELMKRLSPRVNVIPVIGKADSLTPHELAESKKLVMEDIEHYRIPVYNFPYDIEEDDEDTVEENAELRGLMPFAIVGSEEVVEIGGRKVRARQYPWGVVEVDNPRHSDFLAIRSALLHSHLADLKEITHDFLYENYRTEKLSKSVEGGAGA
jgi:septin family protein